MPLNSYIDIKLPAAPSATDPNLHGELLILYNSLRNLISEMSEVYGASIDQGSAINIANSTATPILSLSLPMGAWDITGSAIFYPDTTTNTSLIQYSLATPSEGFHSLYRDTRHYNPAINIGNTIIGGGAVKRNLYLSSAGQINLVAYAGFAGGNMKVYGYLTARRVAG